MPPEPADGVPSPVPPEPADGVPPTIVHSLAAALADRGGSPLIRADADDVSVAAFAELVEGAVADLRAAGMRTGDVLALCAPNRLESAVAIWACARAGFVFAGLPVTLGRIASAAVLAHLEARVVLADGALLADLPAGALPVEQVLRGRREPWDPDVPMPDPDDVYALVLTSGTTGTPKAVMLRHRATMHVAGFYRRLLRLGPGDVTAIHLPFSSVSGHVSQLNPVLLAGASAVLMPRFTPDALIETAARFGVTVLDEVPWAFSLLLRRPGFDPGNLPALRVAFFGGAPMTREVGARLRERFPRLVLHEVYGSSETAGLTTAVRDGAGTPGGEAVGTAADGVELRLGDDGELQVRGPVVTPGYWRNPAATAAVLAGGWLHTGDRAAFRPDGSVRVLGRVVDVINRGGLKVAPEDVERVLADDPDLREVAAFGIPDGAAGEQVAVAVVGAGATPPSPDAVRRRARAALPEHARPRIVLVLDELPRTGNGKVDRVTLRGLAAGS